MRTIIGIILMIVAVILAVWAFIAIVPNFHGEGAVYWFVMSVVVFIAAAAILVGALLIERDLNP